MPVRLYLALVHISQANVDLNGTAKYMSNPQRCAFISYMGVCFEPLERT